MKMFAIIVREKVIGQINVKMPKRKEEDQEVDLIEREEVFQVEDLVVLEKIEKEDLIAAVEVHQAVNLEVILVKVNQSKIIFIFFKIIHYLKFKNIIFSSRSNSEKNN